MLSPRGLPFTKGCPFRTMALAWPIHMKYSALNVFYTLVSPYLLN